jgi:hypothetical protein
VTQTVCNQVARALEQAHLSAGREIPTDQGEFILRGGQAALAAGRHWLAQVQVTPALWYGFDRVLDVAQRAFGCSARIGRQCVA